MAKIKIAQNPTFAAEVNIPRIGGDPVPVEFKFRYLNRTELAKLYDSWRKDIQESSQEHGEDASLEQVIESQIKQQVRQIKDIVVGWAFDDKFTDEAIAELVKTCTGAPQAVIETYQAAYSQARLGN